VAVSQLPLIALMSGRSGIVAATGRHHGGAVQDRIAAPDGRHWFGLRASEADPKLKQLLVGEADRDADFASAVTWPDWSPLDAAWDSAGRIWVSSGDTGVAVFVLADGSWQRHVWEPGSTGDRAPLFDVTTSETVPWIDATPPAGLRVAGGSHA
jgi:hypothetical protein